MLVHFPFYNFFKFAIEKVFYIANLIIFVIQSLKVPELFSCLFALSVCLDDVKRKEIDIKIQSLHPVSLFSLRTILLEKTGFYNVLAGRG